MAKQEYRLNGRFDDLLRAVHDGILGGSMSASFEDGSDWSCGDTRCAVRVYERFSFMGGNRVSLNVTVVGQGQDLFVSAITSGGSQAMLWKLNTLGEEAFLDCLDAVIWEYETGRLAE